MAKQVAFITGITGQDGSYLAELLLSKGYIVHGLIRRASNFNTQRIDHLFADYHETETSLFLHYGDLTDAAGLTNLISYIKPQEIYNLAAQSHVKVSFTMPYYTANVDAVGTITILEAIRSSGLKCKFYQASTSEMFGGTIPPQNEDSRFYPKSPYGAAKLYAHWVTVNYRESYGIHATSGILFNHESPRRGETFVTRKITRAAAAIKLNKQRHLYIGNLDSIRDWGYAKEYVESMWLMLQQDIAEDYVIATGIGATVKQFCKVAFEEVGLDWQEFVRFDDNYLRPSEVDALIGDPTKAKNKLSWSSKTNWEELAKLMVRADVELINQNNK
jgi:GDPmannose 4,6-dehydratase